MRQLGRPRSGREWCLYANDRLTHWVTHHYSWLLGLIQQQHSPPGTVFNHHGSEYSNPRTHGAIFDDTDEHGRSLDHVESQQHFDYEYGWDNHPRAQ